MEYITVLGLAAATCTTISFLPQALKTIQTKDTKDISFAMYLLFTIGTLLWLLFGIFTTNLPITIANSITLIFASIILFYKIKYR